MTATANPLRAGLEGDRTGDACAVVIFGASGDLTTRKLLPALYNLGLSRVLPGSFAVVGVATSPRSSSGRAETSRSRRGRRAAGQRDRAARPQ